jgi:hypothetical protein
MNNRISLSNWVLPISFNQFKTLVAEFQKLAAAVFGTECVIQIRALRQNKVSPTRMHEDGVMDYIAGVNARAVFFESSELAAMTAQVFDAAVYVEVSVTPMNILAGPKFAFGHVEFKGNRPRQATFYLQPEGDPHDFKSLTDSHRCMRIGDGYTFNTSLG